MLKKLPLYPILFSIFPVLSLTAYNIDEISLDVVLRPLLVSLLLGALLFGLARWILRDWYRAALAVLTILFLFFIYGQVYNLLEDVTFGNVSIFRHRTLLPLFGILLVVILYFVARRPHAVHSIYTVVKSSLDLFVDLSLLENLREVLFSRGRQIVPRLFLTARSPRTLNRPDIYYIILDAYGRADVLQKSARI